LCTRCSLRQTTDRGDFNCHWNPSASGAGCVSSRVLTTRTHPNLQTPEGYLARAAPHTDFVQRPATGQHVVLVLNMDRLLSHGLAGPSAGRHTLTVLSRGSNAARFLTKVVTVKPINQSPPCLSRHSVTAECPEGECTWHDRRCSEFRGHARVSMSQCTLTRYASASGGAGDVHLSSHAQRQGAYAGRCKPPRRSCHSSQPAHTLLPPLLAQVRPAERWQLPANVHDRRSWSCRACCTSSAGAPRWTVPVISHGSHAYEVNRPARRRRC